MGGTRWLNGGRGSSYFQGFEAKVGSGLLRAVLYTVQYTVIYAEYRLICKENRPAKRGPVEFICSHLWWRGQPGPG